MKKLNLVLLMFLGFVGMATISSCTPEENDDVKPSMTFSTDNDGITNNKSVVEGESLFFKISAVQNPTTKKSLQSLTIKSITDNTAHIDTVITINAESYLGSFTFYAPPAPQVEKFTFTLTDKAGETSTKVITITATPAVNPNPITSHIDIIMLGAQTNGTYGSYLDANTGTVYKQIQSIPNSAAIDMIYFYGTNASLNNNATLASPKDATVNGGTGNLAMAVGMNPQNDTKFAATTITAAQFDAMTNDADFPATVTAGTKANNLAADDVIAFKTADGKIGLIKIKAFTGTAATGTMTVDVKIQQ